MNKKSYLKGSVIDYKVLNAAGSAKAHWLPWVSLEKTSCSRET